MKIKYSLLLVAALGFFSTAHAEIEQHLDLVYAKYGDRELKLDLYKPKDAAAPLPAIICIHGGGWRTGTKESFTRHAQALAKGNYVTVSINYRLSEEAPFPAHIMDCKAAVRWLRANAETYGIDPDRIGAVGHSAGGHLAALLATSGGVKELEGDGGNAEFSSTIQAAVPSGAQSDLETDRIRSMTAQSGADIWHLYLNGPLDENLELYRLASPRRHLDPSDPPMMFITGGKDNLDTHAGPIRADMRRMDMTTGLLIIPGAPHGLLGAKGEKWWAELAQSTTLDFFDRYLRKAE
jgi:pectinesterase